MKSIIKKCKCQKCNSENIDLLTTQFGKKIVKGAIFCYGCGTPTYFN